MVRRTSGVKKKETEWTEGRWKAFVVSVLRSGTQKYPEKYETLNAAKTIKKVNVKTGRIAQHYQCAVCLLDFPQTNVQVDHIIPIVGPEGFTSWDSYIPALYCKRDNLQVLCKEDHARKTKREREESRSQKKTIK
ncbi:HNH endonuclease [Candidatus Pacearchaeota archaeon]|nr:HNH endonuclease [Candidatus Pacearchaeota archaeon]